MSISFRIVKFIRVTDFKRIGKNLNFIDKIWWLLDKISESKGSERKDFSQKAWKRYIRDVVKAMR